MNDGGVDPLISDNTDQKGLLNKFKRYFVIYHITDAWLKK